jgi:hypothetical protein
VLVTLVDVASVDETRCVVLARCSPADVSVSRPSDERAIVSLALVEIAMPHVRACE